MISKFWHASVRSPQSPKSMSDDDNAKESPAHKRDRGKTLSADSTRQKVQPSICLYNCILSVVVAGGDKDEDDFDENDQVVDTMTATSIEGCSSDHGSESSNIIFVPMEEGQDEYLDAWSATTADSPRAGAGGMAPLPTVVTTICCGRQLQLQNTDSILVEDIIAKIKLFLRDSSVRTADGLVSSCCIKKCLDADILTEGMLALASRIKDFDYDLVLLSKSLKETWESQLLLCPLSSNALEMKRLYTNRIEEWRA